MAEEVEMCVEIASKIDNTWIEKADINLLCRACATETNENMIPIFEGTGLELDLQAKIDKHLPVKITKDDGLPNKMCVQCASTLVAWHDIYTGCTDAETKLKNLLNKSKDDTHAAEKVASSSVEREDLVTEKPKSQQKVAGEMEVDDNDSDYIYEGDEDDDDYVQDDDDNDEDEDGDEEQETEEVVIEKLDSKEKGKTVEITDKGTIIRDQFLETSSASVSKMRPGRKACSDQHSDCVRKCMKKSLKINSACDNCGESFISQVDLLFHVKRMHDRLNAYKCNKCSAAFKCLLKYKIHVEQDHQQFNTDKKEDDCDVIQTRSTGKSKTSRQSKDSPELSDDQAPLMKSEDDDDDDDELVGDAHSNDHSIYSEDEKSLNDEGKKDEKSSREENPNSNKVTITSCSICSAPCKSSLQLLRHWKKFHTTEEAKSDPKYVKFNFIHKCNVCDLFLKTIRAGIEHKKNAHGIEHNIPFTEEEEEQLKQGEQILFNGLKTYQCTYCPVRIVCVHRYLNHIAKHKGQLPWHCRLCGMTFHVKSQLKLHTQITHERVRNKCEFCGKEFSCKSNLMQHKRSKHLDERAYVCNVCGLAFKACGLLYLHRRSHTNYKPYQCEQCNTGYSRRSILITHIERKHSSEKPYVCEVCGASFSCRDTLMRSHMKTHSDVRPHKCAMCGCAYKTSYHLKRHISVKHSLEKDLHTVSQSQ